MPPPRKPYTRYNDPPVGAVFGRLTVTGPSTSERIGNQLVRSVPCCCSCGTERSIGLGKLMRGESRSCGCMAKEALTRSNRTHGASGTLLYQIWTSMKQRCTNPSRVYWMDYGGRGIVVCDEWTSSFEAFRDWSIANGYVEGAALELDRVDNDGNYEPDNCRWTTKPINRRNTRRNRMLTAFGETKTMAEWAEDPRCRANYNVLNRRISSLGWTDEAAITEPVHTEKSRAAIRHSDAIPLILAGSSVPLSRDELKGILERQGYDVRSDKSLREILNRLVLGGHVVRQGWLYHAPGLQVDVPQQAGSERGLRAFNETKSAEDWACDERAGEGVSASLIRSRLNQLRWDPERAVSEPVRDGTGTAFGEQRSLKNWIGDPRVVVTSYRTLARRLASGWDLEEALTTPDRRRRVDLGA